MSQHLMHRLAIAREDPSIREAVPANSFRSQAQAVQEAQMMRAASMAKARKQMAAGQQPQQGQDPRMGAGRGAGAGAGAGAGSIAAGTGSISQSSQPQGMQQRQKPSTGQVRRLTGTHLNFPGAAPIPGSTPTPPPPPPPQAPILPFVFRRAAFDVQITDPASGDILQLDQGTWVLSAAAPNPRTRTLNVYTTDPDTGLVLTYELPIPDGNLNNVFDSHTLNVIETMMAQQQQQLGAAADTTTTTGTAEDSTVDEEGLEYGM